jgi:hypothetical protein
MACRLRTSVVENRAGGKHLRFGLCAALQEAVICQLHKGTDGSVHLALGCAYIGLEVGPPVVVGAHFRASRVKKDRAG